MPTMTDVHRHLLQYLMKEHYCSANQLEQQLNQYKQQYKNNNNNNNNQSQQQSQSNIDQAPLSEFIKTINESLNFMHLIIKSTKHPKTKLVYYGLVNELDDEIAKQATEFSAHEMTLVREVMKHLVDIEMEGMGSGANMADLLNLRDNKTSMTDMESLIQRLLSDGWLEKMESNSRSIWFGVRTLLELRGYLTDQFAYDPLE